MGRHKGVPNRPREVTNLIPGEAQATLTDAQEPIRLLRRRAKLTGVRFIDTTDRETIISEVDRLGECDETAFESTSDKGDGRISFTIQNSYRLFVTDQDEFWVENARGHVVFAPGCSLTLFTESLGQMADVADEYFDAEYERVQKEKSETESRLAETVDVVEVPNPNTAEQKMILLFAKKEMGIDNCDVQFAAVKVCEYFGLSLGTTIEDEGEEVNERWPNEVIQTNAYKAIVGAK